MEDKRLEKLLGYADDKHLAVFEELEGINESAEKIVDIFSGLDISKLEVMKGEKGDPGDRGDQGESGRDGKDGTDGKNGKDGKDGQDGQDGLDGRDGKDGKDGRNGINGKDGSPDSPEQVVDKVNIASKKIKAFQVEGLTDLDRIVKNNNFDFRIGVSKTEVAALENRIVTLENSPGGSGHTVQDEGVSLTARTYLNFVGAGVTVTDDSGNDATKVTISGGGAGGVTVETPTGAVDASNATYTVTGEPQWVVADGITYFDGAGYTYAALTITMDVAPSQYIRYFY